MRRVTLKSTFYLELMSLCSDVSLVMRFPAVKRYACLDKLGILSLQCEDELTCFFSFLVETLGPVMGNDYIAIPLTFLNIKFLFQLVK